MISVEAALSLVLDRSGPLPAVATPLADALGRVLAEDVASDIDSPPHDKSLMDGYAVVATDVREGVELTVIEEVTAGLVPTKRLQPGSATRIMTGAPMPDGADAVVVVERTELVNDRVVRIDAGSATPGQNVMPRATSLQRGATVLQRGHKLRPIEVGLLAEIGATSVATYPQPSIAVLSTGDELVPVEATPAAGQIRNSNGPMLAALAARAGGSASQLGIGRDDETELTSLVRSGLDHDVLLLSGGVSAGVLDLVPGVFAKLGVEQVFHKVSLKPGKPLWFGTCRREQHSTLVFGLPGNPVSSLVCFELFVRPAIASLAGRSGQGLTLARAQLTAVHQQRGARPTYYPAQLTTADDKSTVRPLEWKGSADLCTLAAANCLAHFPAGDRAFECGEWLDVLQFDD